MLNVSQRLYSRCKLSGPMANVTGFAIVESLAMLGAILVFTWICFGVAKKKEFWPFDKHVPPRIQGQVHAK